MHISLDAAGARLFICDTEIAGFAKLVLDEDGFSLLLTPNESDPGQTALAAAASSDRPIRMTVMIKAEKRGFEARVTSHQVRDAYIVAAIAITSETVERLTA